MQVKHLNRWCLASIMFIILISVLPCKEYPNELCSGGDVNVFNFLGYTIHCVRENVPIFRTISSVFIMTFHLKPQMSDTCRKGRGIANFCGNKSDVIFHKVQSFDLLAVLHQKSGDQDFSCGHNGYLYQMSRQSIP